jgi:hypothetical protein
MTLFLADGLEYSIVISEIPKFCFKVCFGLKTGTLSSCAKDEMLNAAKRKMVMKAFIIIDCL